MIKLVLILVSVPLLAIAQEGKNFIDQNYIEVVGKAEIDVVPDLIYLRITINERDSKNKVSLAELERAMISSLKALGVDVNKELRVEDVAGSYRSYFLAKGEVKLSKSYQLVIKDPKNVGKVFEELAKTGVSNVVIEKIDNTNMAKIRQEVKVAAIRAAKEKAEALVGAIGQSIGRSIFIQELEPYFGPGGRSYKVAANTTWDLNPESIDQMAGDQDLSFEKIKLAYSILVRFELK